MSGNNGSASMLFGLVDNISKELKDVRFNVFTYYPKKDREKNQYENVYIYSGSPLTLLTHIVPITFLILIIRKLGLKIPELLMTREVNALATSDLILDVGGTTFTDAKQYKAIFSVLCILPGIFLGKKQMKISQTMGPFNKFFNRVMAKMFLPKLDLIIGRGSDSESCLKKLGLNNVTFRTDASFTMKIGKDIISRMEKVYRPLFKGKKVVGIAPNSIVEGYCIKKGKNHAKIFSSFIDYLISEDYFVLLIPHSIRFNTKSKHNNDLYTIRNIYGKVKQKKYCLKIENDYDAREFRALIGLTDFFIASRFHSMISALAMQVPLNVYGWGFHKYSEVMQEFELEKNVFDYNELKVERMIERFNELVYNKNYVISKIRKNLPRVIESSQTHAELIKRILNRETCGT